LNKSRQPKKLPTPGAVVNANASKSPRLSQKPPQDQFQAADWSANNSAWPSAEESAPAPTPHRKRTLPQIRPPSRTKNAAVSLPQTPVRQLPPTVSKRTSAPVSRTTSADYEFSQQYNENYNYAYVSNDNLPTDQRSSGVSDLSYQVNAPGYQSHQYSSSYPSTYQSHVIPTTYQQTAISYEQAVSGLQQISNEDTQFSFEQSNNGYQQGTTSYPQVVSSYQQPPASFPQTPSHYQSTPTGYQQTSSSYQPTPTSYQQPTTSYPQTPNSYSKTSSSYQETPVSYHHTPTSYQQTPTSYQPTSYQDVPSSYPQTSTSYQTATSYQQSNYSENYGQELSYQTPTSTYQGPTDPYSVSNEPYQSAGVFTSEQSYLPADAYKPEEPYSKQSTYLSKDDQYHDALGYSADSYPTYPNQGQSYNDQPTDYYYSNDGYYDGEIKSSITQKKYLGRRSISPLTQQNTDSLESRDDELRDESFETAVDSICSSVPQKVNEPLPLPSTTNSTIPSASVTVSTPAQPQPKPKPAETGLFSGILGHGNKQPSQAQTQNQKEQPSLLSNPAQTAMNVTKGLFSSLTNVVNNTVQNINKQQKPQPPTENQVQRIQVTKRGSLKPQESIIPDRQKSFEEYIPEEELPIYQDTIYQDEYDGQQYAKDMYNEQRERYTNDVIKEEEDEYYEEWTAPAPRRGSLQHQATVDSYLPPRGPLRGQESVDSCAEEIAAMTSERGSPEPYPEAHDNSLIQPYHPHPDPYPPTDLYDEEPYSPHASNSKIEPYYPTKKAVSPSPPAIQKQQSIDIDGTGYPPSVTSPPAVAITSPEKIVAFGEEQPVKTVHAPPPERRKMTAKERWHRAYNMIVQQLNVSFLFYSFTVCSLLIKERKKTGLVISSIRPCLTNN